MKTITKRLTVLLGVLALFMISYAIMINAFVADDVKGLYWNGEKTAHIRIYKATNGKYYGKIEHLTEPNDENGKPKKDPENPNAKLRSRDRMGMVVMNGFEWNDKEQMWENGTIYDPNNGKTYDGYMKFEGSSKSKLYLRGYVMGMTWLGRTSEWVRIK